MDTNGSTTGIMLQCNCSIIGAETPVSNQTNPHCMPDRREDESRLAYARRVADDHPDETIRWTQTAPAALIAEASAEYPEQASAQRLVRACLTVSIGARESSEQAEQLEDEIANLVSTQSDVASAISDMAGELDPVEAVVDVGDDPEFVPTDEERGRGASDTDPDH